MILKKIRFSAVAGQFYPANKKELTEMVDGFLKKATNPKINGEIFGLLLPHAGYLFSGVVSGWGVKAVFARSYQTLIIIGDSHYERFEGVSVWPEGEWETPLGRVEVDSKLAKKILSESKRFFIRDSAHLFEHSIEVEIPFFQRALKKFKILPIIFGSENKDWKNLARAILKNIKGKKVLVVASSDLSHYPSYEQARRVDKETLEAILKVDPEALDKKLRKLEKRRVSGVQTFLCAEDSVKTLLEIAKKLKAKARLLKYANSGDVFYGDKTRVVGYGTVVFYGGNNNQGIIEEKRDKNFKK